MPIVEDHLEELVREGQAAGRLRFVVGAAAAVEGAEFVFLCVPTPQGDDGSADLSYVEAVAEEIGPLLAAREPIIVNKSTVPVGSTLVVERVLGRSDVTVVSNPEFLREGTAVPDSLHPERIVVGADDQAAAAKVGDLFAGTHAPLLITDAATAETIKYASNAFLATKLSFVNAVAGLCEAVGADVRDVILGLGLRQADRVRVPAPGPGLGRELPAQGHPGAGPHRRAGRVRLLLPEGGHRHQRRAVRAGGATRCAPRWATSSRAPSSPCGG